MSITISLISLLIRPMLTAAPRGHVVGLCGNRSAAHAGRNQPNGLLVRVRVVEASWLVLPGGPQVRDLASPSPCSTVDLWVGRFSGLPGGPGAAGDVTPANARRRPRYKRHNPSPNLTIYHNTDYAAGSAGLVFAVGSRRGGRTGPAARPLRRHLSGSRQCPRLTTLNRPPDRNGPW
jgi:hypothetical protein